MAPWSTTLVAVSVLVAGVFVSGIAAQCSIALRGASLVTADSDATPMDMLITAGVVAELAVEVSQGSVLPITATGLFFVPAGIDSHTHLSYRRQPGDLLDGGIMAAIDIASPLSFINDSAADSAAMTSGPLNVIASGPVIIYPGGFPGGVGGEAWAAANLNATYDAINVMAATAAVATITKNTTGSSVGVIAIGLATNNTLLSLAAAQVAAITNAAHAEGIKVAAYALDANATEIAAMNGVDLLAAVPTELMSANQTALWANKTVVTSLDALGATPDQLANLAAFKAAGTRILYGSQFGETTGTGFNPDEINAMSAAGMTPAEILAACTTAPAAFWGLPGHGTLERGSRGSFLVLSEDPRSNPAALASALMVVIDGAERRCIPANTTACQICNTDLVVVPTEEPDTTDDRELVIGAVVTISILAWGGIAAYVAYEWTQDFGKETFAPGGIGSPGGANAVITAPAASNGL